MDADRNFAQLEKAWHALEQGEPERALELSRRADEGARETWLLRTQASLELDDLRGARAAIERAATLDDDGGDAAEVDLRAMRAEVSLREWRIDDARTDLEAALALERLPSALVRLAMCHELDGEFDAANALFDEAAELEPEICALPPRLSEEEFSDVVDEAVAHLPDAFQVALAEVPVLIEPMPGRDLARRESLEDLAETPPDLLGVFTGVSRLERSHDAGLELPPTIHLFQRNLERSSLDRDELIEQIRITLFHELAHFLGFDEEGVADLGLE